MLGCGVGWAGWGRLWGRLWGMLWGRLGQAVGREVRLVFGVMAACEGRVSDVSRTCLGRVSGSVVLGAWVARLESGGLQHVLLLGARLEQHGRRAT